MSANNSPEVDTMTRRGHGKRYVIGMPVALLTLIAALAIFGYAPWMAAFDSASSGSASSSTTSPPPPTSEERDFDEVYLHTVVGLAVPDALKELGYPNKNSLRNPSLVAEPSGENLNIPASDLTVTAACVRGGDKTLFLGVTPTAGMSKEYLDLKEYQRSHNDAGGIDRYNLVNSRGCTNTVFSVAIWK